MIHVVWYIPPPKVIYDAVWYNPSSSSRSSGSIISSSSSGSSISSSSISSTAEVPQRQHSDSNLDSAYVYGAACRSLVAYASWARQSILGGAGQHVLAHGSQMTFLELFAAVQTILCWTFVVFDAGHLVRTDLRCCNWTRPIYGRTPKKIDSSQRLHQPMEGNRHETNSWFETNEEVT